MDRSRLTWAIVAVWGLVWANHAGVAHAQLEGNLDADGAVTMPASNGPGTGDRRLRLVILSRFGFRGHLKARIVDSVFDGGTVKGTPEATFGFDLRVEKPVHRYLSVGGLASNYWLFSREDYALDLSALVKPRYPFRAGEREAEAYVAVHVGGSLIRNSATTIVFMGETQIETEVTRTSGGFNVGIAPGFQVFVAEPVALVFEVGYAFSWFRIRGPLFNRLSIGQATVRVGLSFAF